MQSDPLSDAAMAKKYGWTKEQMAHRPKKAGEMHPELARAVAAVMVALATPSEGLDASDFATLNEAGGR